MLLMDNSAAFPRAKPFLSLPVLLAHLVLPLRSFYVNMASRWSDGAALAPIHVKTMTLSIVLR